MSPRAHLLPFSKSYCYSLMMVCGNRCFATLVNAVSKHGNMGLTISKNSDFSQWYTQCLTKSELLDYSEVSGCYILRPLGQTIWKHIQNYLSNGFASRSIQDVTFPLLIPESSLRKEQAHLEGFSPEVAWVTHAGDAPLSVRLAIRPTSETSMYPAYAKWIKTARDLPLRLNQWCNVVRWEFRNPQPLIRSREFLWQEGHTAFSNKEEADLEVRDILSLYRKTYEDLLAVPVIDGWKSENEKFAGADYTTSIEAFIPEAGRAIQAATSHCLGQNFAKMFNIKFENSEGKSDYVWQNSWGFTTRSIGIMVMTHSDDIGLVLPPKVAPIQVVIVPVGITSKLNNEIEIVNYCIKIADLLSASGVRVKIDLERNRTPGWKFSEWELKGVPLRLEIGPTELGNSTISATIRHNGQKMTFPMESLISKVPSIMIEIHDEMLKKSREKFNSSIILASTWSNVLGALNEQKLVLMPWCERPICEISIKGRTNFTNEKGATSAGAKSLCIPFEQPITTHHHQQQQPITPLNCAACGEKAHRWTLFGKSY